MTSTRSAWLHIQPPATCWARKQTGPGRAGWHSRWRWFRRHGRPRQTRRPDLAAGQAVFQHGWLQRQGCGRCRRDGEDVVPSRLSRCHLKG
jgi:hypothetical protein